MYFAGLNKGKGSIEGLKNAQNVARQSSIGLTIAQTALNMAISMGLMAAISLAIKGFDKLINSAKRASEAADEAFSDTNEKVQQNEEEAKSLDELISKYKELKESGNLDIDGRKEVKELQNDIADLVGTQAKNLDLVNGKLDEEIEKLNKISAKDAKDAYETATANYFNSQKASEEATGDDSYVFFDGYAYVGKKEKEPIKILQDAGFNNAVQTAGINPFNRQVFVMDTFDNDFKELKGAQEKADYLQSMIDVLEQNGQRATDLYAGLIKQRDNYLKYIDNQQNAANSLVNSWIIYSQFSNEELSKINVDSVESFDTYRQKMIEEAKNDESIGKVLADGTLSDENLEKAVNDFMATSLNFSKWYEQWLGNVQDSTSEHETYTLLSFKQAFNADSFKDTKEKLLELATSGELSAETLSSNEEYKTLIDQTGLSAEELVQKIKKFNIKEKDTNITNLQQVLSDMQAGKTLNTAEVSKLIAENDSLAGAVIKVGDSYQIEEDALESLINSNIEQYNIAVSNQNEETKVAIRETKERIKAYEAEIKAIDILKNKLSSKADSSSGWQGELWKNAEKFINPLLTKTQDKISNGKKSAEESLKELDELMNSLKDPLDEGGDGNSSNSSSSTIDFIEILLEKVSKATEKIKNAFEDAFSLKSAKKNLSSALSQIQKEIATNTSAYAKYMEEANKVGLDQYYVAQIQNGSLNIEPFDTSNDDSSDKELYDKIQKYQEWYDKAQACKETIDSLHDSEKELKESYVDKITEYYDRKANKYQNNLDKTDGLISMNEDLYSYTSASLYSKDMKQTGNKISVYKSEISALLNEQKKVNKNTNPSLWYKYQDAIDEAKSSIDDLADSYLSLAKSKAEVSITKRDAKVETLNATKSLNESKMENAVGYENKNAIIDNNISVEKATLSQYETAKNNADALFVKEQNQSKNKSFQSKLAKSGISNALISSANTAIRNGKKIPAKVLNALKKNIAGNKNANKAYQQFLEYNTALDTKKTANTDYKQQVQESKSNIKQYQQQALDNIVEYYDLQIQTLQDAQSRLDAEQERLTALGNKTTESYYKTSISNLGQQNAILYDKRNELMNQLEENNWDKNSKEYKNALSTLNDIEIQLQNNAKSQIEWNNTILNIPIDNLNQALELIEAIGSANASVIDYYKAIRGYSIESDFKTQIADNEKQIALQKELSEIYAKNAAIAASSSNNAYGGKTYEEWMISVQNTKSDIYGLETENENLKDSLRDEVYLKPFEDMITYAERAISKIKDLQSLMDTFDFTLYDDEGNLNEYGLAKLQLEFNELEGTRKTLSGIVDELNEVEDLYADGNMNETEYLEKKTELQDNYNSTLLESADIMKNITDMMKEYSQERVDYIKEQIDAYKELLSAEKEENDYQRSLKDKTDNISTLQKRILSLGNGNTEETQAEYQKVLNELENAKEDLQQTEWEHYIELQTQALEDLSENLDDYLNNIDVTLESIEETLKSAQGIVADVDSSELLNKILALVGGDKDIFSGTGTESSKYSITKTELKNMADEQISALYDIIHSKPEGDRYANDQIGKLQALLNDNDWDGLIEFFEKLNGIDYALLQSDYTDMNKTTIMEDFAEMIEKYGISDTGGLIKSAAEALEKYLDSENDTDKNTYLNKINESLNSAIALIGRNGNADSPIIDSIKNVLVPYLESIGIDLPGFASGGMIKAVKRNGDDGLVSLEAGEGVLNEEQLSLLYSNLNALENFVPIVPNINSSLQDLQTVNPISRLSAMQNNAVGEVNINLECPATTQEELYDWLQSSKTQKIIQSSVVNPIMGNGSFGRYQY